MELNESNLLKMSTVKLFPKLHDCGFPKFGTTKRDCWMLKVDISV